jgi:hypothetical protein
VGILVILVNLILSAAWAQNNCVMLEGLNLGCVSSIDHSCFMNKKVDKPSEPCRYVGSPATQWRVEGPISFNCKSSRNIRECPPQVCNSDGCTQPPCTERSECLEYFRPICDETCVKCFNDVINVNVGVSRGCIICTRRPCPDEEPAMARVKCPPRYNNLVNNAGQKCSSDSRCPETATDPLGVVHPVEIRRGTCPPPEMPEAPREEEDPKHCPWKVDQRTATGCERIKCDNQNPQAAPDCVDP